MQLPIIAHISGSAEIRSTGSAQRRGERREGGETRAQETEARRDRKKDCAGSAKLRQEEYEEEVWKLWEL